MRLAVFALVLANLLLFVWARGYLGAPAEPDSRRAEQQLLPERVVVVSRGEPPPSARHKEDGETAGERKPNESCQIWSDLAASEADQVEQLLQEGFAAFRASRRTVNENSGYWVYVPPLANKEEVSKKTAELQQLGVDDFFVVQASGPNQLAISLGTYRTEEAANAGLEALRAKGVKSARMSERRGKPTYVILEIRGPAAQAEALQQSIAAKLPKATGRACKANAVTAP
ncbi:MAG TPA: SPOR domain-containing protein [Candidatus Accumulibacter phosphatis]|nr:MAG: Sporulation related domain protein [Candidatus Accumulibacter sp. SK-11]HRL74843.1 SPOR domain-containing protein [Candidatus Accumulibacter phosphatis]HRQ95042.1 SPOR domain-containing protein [Candidatus Accumulibacter phosphatis]